eukprot:86143_1
MDPRSAVSLWMKRRQKQEVDSLNVTILDDSKVDRGDILLRISPKGDPSLATQIQVLCSKSSFRISSDISDFDEMVNDSISERSRTSIDDVLDDVLSSYQQYSTSAASDPEEMDCCDDGWDDDGDGDWGDAFEEDGPVAIATDDLEHWATLKRRWINKEEELRKKYKTELHQFEFKEKNIFTGAAVSEMLRSSLMIMMKDDDSGLVVHPVDDNIYHWRVRMSQFNESCRLNMDLTKLDSLYGYSYVELDIKFSMDIYPFYPPDVRLVKPRLENFMFGRIVCMEELQLSKWNPVRQISDIFKAIKRLLTKYGAVNVDDEANDPSKGNEPCTELEYQLLRLSMLTETQPRVNYLLSDDHMKRLPEFGAKKLEPSKGKPKPKKQKSTGSKTAWKSGVGFGHSGNCSDWDMAAHNAAQKKKDSEVNAILAMIITEMGTMKALDTYTVQWVEHSCLIPFLISYLRNDSIIDIDRHSDIYMSIFLICKNLARHLNLGHLFLKLPDQSTSIMKLTAGLAEQAQLSQKLSRVAPALPSIGTQAQAESVSPILGLILEMDGAVKEVVAHLQRERSSSNTAEEKQDVYVRVMTKYRFKTVTKFDVHTIMKTLPVASGVSRQLLKRLSSEYTDLSKSLPISDDSSILMRVLEDKMNFCQFLIIAPDQTPYEAGCFLFDVHFPPQYPNAPPKVLIQTTGRGSVRFNPNLYNTGKVCLSLLGTWAGKTQGEQWNAENSTFLQVAISIQSLILVPEPYFNEPGYEQSIGTSRGTSSSNQYNQTIQQATVRWAMIEMIRNPPTPFRDAILSHFFLRKNRVLELAEGWLGPGNKLVQELRTELGKLKSLPHLE